MAGSFARSLESLILTQGVVYGLGFITFYYPVLSMLNEWWIARKGLAYGLMCSASGVSGAIWPSAIQAALNRYGYPTTLRAIAVGLCLVTGPLIPLIRGRVPETTAGAASRTDWTFLRASLFWVYSASNFAMGLGFFFPSLYVPSYATSNGLTATQGALLLTMMSVSQVCGQLGFGYLSDRKVPLESLAGSSMIIAGIAVFACWGLARTFGILALFCIVYGFFGAGYTALWGRMGTAVSQDPNAAFAAFGLLNVGKGVGNVLAGPISGALLQRTVIVGSYGASKYHAVVLFSGSCLALSATIIPVSYALRWHRSE